MPPDTVAAALARLRRRFGDAGIETAALDARVLTMHALALNHAALIADPDRALSTAGAAALEAAALRRIAGETVSRIIGFREFHGRRFTVTADTLDPRPDTETLVEAALDACRDRAPARILDLGTGTGCLAVTLLLAFPKATAVASDLSRAALDVAQTNASAHGVGHRLRLVRSDWWENIEGRFDLVVSNPPYIATPAIAGLPPEVRLGDPLIALDGGADGLAAYRGIAAGARAHLAGRGLLLVEIGEGQADDIVEVLGLAGLRPKARGQARMIDLGGRERVLAFDWPDGGEGTAAAKKQLE
jgi:release factor glutamine methyltransferase